MAPRGQEKRPINTRSVAARVLRDIEQRSAFSNRVLSEHLERHADWDARDRGLLTAMVYGVLRHRTRLDVHIDAAATKAGKLKGEVRQMLRVGAYELLEMQHPPHAVLTEAGHAAASLSGGGGLRKAMHGILARVVENRVSTEASLLQGSTLDILDKRWSIPRWLAGRWIKELGSETALARAAALASPPPIDLRVDLHRSSRDIVLARLGADHPRATAEVVEDQPQALRVHHAGDIFHGPLHDEGLISVQGLAAQQPARWLAPQAGERILDACSGLGVKTLQLAELMLRRGTIIAADLDERHVANHEDLSARGRMGDELDHRYIVTDLAEDHPELDDEPFDGVLLDVPCTGLGNLARHPEIRWLRQFDDIAARASLQRTLLSRNLARVRPGGRLVYAVCSPAPEEGTALVDTVIAEHSAEWTCTRRQTFTPERDGTEGFFVAHLSRAPTTNSGLQGPSLAI